MAIFEEKEPLTRKGERFTYFLVTDRYLKPYASTFTWDGALRLAHFFPRCRVFGCVKEGEGYGQYHVYSD